MLIVGKTVLNASKEQIVFLIFVLNAKVTSTLIFQVVLRPVQLNSMTMVKFALDVDQTALNALTMKSALYVTLDSKLTMQPVNAMKFVLRVISVNPMNVSHVQTTV